MANDVRAYAKFIEVHNSGVRAEREWGNSHRAYLASTREWDARRLASKQAHEAFEKIQPNWDSFDEAGDRKEDEEEEKKIAPPPFTEPAPKTLDPPVYPTHYWDQITKDVDRSLWKQCPDETDRNSKRVMLHRMICAVLILAKDDEDKELHYFQGYHDLAAVCLLTCGEQIGFSILKQLSKTYLRYD